MKRILIVDDSGMARSYIRQCLEIALTEEVDFVEAVDGVDALSKMKAAKPDLLVTDLNMPKMNGSELVNKVAASPKLHGVPSIVVTSLVNQARIDELKSCGATAILGKPVEPQDLSLALREIFGSDDDEDNDGFFA